MEASEYGLARGTCFVARRPEVVAVAGLLWISWCVLGAAGFVFFFPRFFSPSAHGLLQVCGRLAPFTSLLVTDTSSDLLELPIYCLKLLTKAQKLQTRNAKIR